MKYKVVKNAKGVVVAFGPNTKQYVPNITKGDALDFVDVMPVLVKNPNDFSHTRRQFRMLLTDAHEAEIKAAFQALKRGKVKRALRIWWNDETIYRWDDVEMQKILKLVTPATAAAIEAAWIGKIV